MYRALAIAALLIATVLSVFKPRGVTRWGASNEPSTQS